MIENKYSGKLVVFDGANGSGKSTIIKRLRDKLIANNIDILYTYEPTNSLIGELTRRESERVSGNSLACLVAADRYKHLEDEIIPALKEGKVVLCDRYLLSSFILQGMDNVSYEFISKLNSEIIKPDIQIVLYASEEVIQRRLGARSKLTRFERNNRTVEEICFLNKGLSFMKNRYNIYSYNFNTEENIDENIDRIFNLIKECL